MSLLDILDRAPLVTPDLIAAKGGARLSQMERIYIEEVIMMYENLIASGALIPKSEHERLVQEAYERGSDNPPMLIDPTSGR